jgi:hypothetical protein
MRKANWQLKNTGNDIMIHPLGFPNVPTNYDEYLLWHLEGYALGDLIAAINSEWIISNFNWLYQNKLISRVLHIPDAVCNNPIINVYMGNVVATYTMHNEELYNRAYRTIAHCAPHELDTA